jgi:hypothetical protein
MVPQDLTFKTVSEVSTAAGEILSHSLVNMDEKVETALPFLTPSRNLGFLSQLFRRQGH